MIGNEIQFKIKSGWKFMQLLKRCDFIELKIKFKPFNNENQPWKHKIHANLKSLVV